MPVGGRVRRLLDAARTLGARRITPSLLRWTVLREFVVFARDLRVPSPDEVPDPSLYWTDLSGSTAPLLTEIDPAFDAKELGRLLREGQYCRLGWMGSRLVHYRWDTLQPAYLPYLGRRYRPREGDVLTSWLYTAPDRRGRGVQRASHADLREQALARGCRRSLGIVAVWNAPSLRTNDHTGRTRVGTVGYVAIGPWRRYFATGSVRLDRDGDVTVLGE
jgi:GNAT superfamily N-acetyltransferase